MANKSSESKAIAQLNTQLHACEEKIKEFEREREGLKSLIRYSSLGVVTVNRDMIITSCNSVFEDLFGYKAPEITGKNLDDIIAKDIHLTEASEYSRKTLKGVPVHRIGKRFRKDGSLIDVEFFAVPIKIAGKVVGAYGLYQDVSERIVTREKLKESEERLKRLFQASPLGIGLIRGRIMQWHNEAMSKLLGYSLKELIGKDARMLYPDDREYRRAGESIALLGTGERTTGLDTRWVRKNGEVFDCHVWYSRLSFGSEGDAILAIAEDITDRKKAERLLQESEERYRQLIEASPLAVCVFDDREVFFANPAALKIAEVKSIEEVADKRLLDFIKKDFRSMIRKRLKTLLSGQTNLPAINIKAITLKGHEVDVEAYSIPVRFNEKPAVLSVFSDVTEKRKAEARLREEEEKYRKLYEESKQQEELYRSLLNSSSDAIVIYNLQGEAEYISPSFTKTFGWTFEEVRGKRIAFLPKSEKETTMAVIADLVEKGTQVHGFETRRLTKDGKLLNISISASRYVDHAGNPVGMLVVLRDITERIRAEEATRQSEKRFRELYDSVSDLIYTQDLQGRFLSVNRALVDLMGYAAEEMIGRKGSDFMKADLKPLYESEYLATIKNPKYGCHQGTSVYIAKDGRKIYLEHNSILIKHKGATPYISGVARDVTERILDSRRIKKLREEMLQAQKMEAIGRLAGGIAHDFNNLLMGIQGNISLMEMQSSPEDPGYERLKNIEEYVKSGADLTKRLLGFARGGRYEIVPTDINDLINNESKLFGRAKKEIAIHKKFQEDSWTVEVDQGQMGQVFLNLFVNAWQAMPKGGHIYLQTENIMLREGEADYFSLPPGRYVKVTISDTGVGMDEETQKRVFEPFFTTKKKERGTGLGLASVYGIIKNHGGIIKVESQVGHGTTFILYLPATDKEPLKSQSDSQGEIITGKERILLVDDEEKILDIGKQLLEVLGYEVLTAENGKKAIEIFSKEKNNLALIVLDMIMPGMGGRETFAALRKISPDIKVLLASGYSIDGEASEIMAQGCNGFIQKPFSIKRLSKKIREVLGGQ